MNFVAKSVFNLRNFTFRKATQADVPNLLSFQSKIKRIDSSVPELLYCSFDDKGDMIGHVYGSELSSTSILIDSVILSEKYRGHGLGRHMLQKYLDLLKSVGKYRGVIALSPYQHLKTFTTCGFEIKGLPTNLPIDCMEETMMELQIDLQSAEQFQVDSFTEIAFSGNPAAVVFEHRSDWWMQKIAEENNLGATGFVRPNPFDDTSSSHYDIRWYTANKQLEICGHATLAAAHLLYETKRVPAQQPIVFHTVHSGQLRAQGLPDGSIELDFPTNPPVAFEPTAAEWSYITEGLGITQQDVKFVGRSLYDVLVEVTPRAFAGLNPKNLSAIEQLGGRGLIVTCVGGLHSNTESQSQSERNTERSVDDTAPRHKIVCDERFDFLSRFFAPRIALNEDYVTGSSHCTLTPYWFSSLTQRWPGAMAGKQSLSAYQPSLRGGGMVVSMSGDRVLLRGKAVTTIKSRIIA